MAKTTATDHFQISYGIGGGGRIRHRRSGKKGSQDSDGKVDGGGSRSNSRGRRQLEFGGLLSVDLPSLLAHGPLLDDG